MANLESASLAELKAEVERREQEAANAAKAARVLKNEKVFKHRDAILELMSHGRTSCSDENPCNGSLDTVGGRAPRCYKCAFINLTEFDLDEVELDVTVSVRGA